MVAHKIKGARYSGSSLHICSRMNLGQTFQTPPRRHRVRKHFTEDEDDQLRQLVELHGEDDWQTVSHFMPGRDSRQCKERWSHYLSPNLRTESWTPEEDDLLNHKVQEMGRKWKVFEIFFPGRTDISIKNRYNLLERKRRRDLKKAQRMMCKRSARIQAPESLNKTETPEPSMPDWDKEREMWNDLFDDNGELLGFSDWGEGLYSL